MAQQQAMARGVEEASVAFEAPAAPILVFRATPMERIRMIRGGMKAADAKRVIADLDLPQGEALKALNLSAATVNKKAKQDQSLTSDESERVLGVLRLVGQLEVMVQESGDPDGFDARAWISQWLREPLPALGGRRPVDLIDTMEGQALVSTTLEQIQSGAYA